MAAPIDHPLRFPLAAELHARPFAELEAPERISHIAMLTGTGSRDTERDCLDELCSRLGGTPPSEEATHHIMDFGTFRLKWERHTEFTTYTFLRHGPFDSPFAEPAASLVPADWLTGLPGERVVAMHLALLPADGDRADATVAKHLAESSLCRATVLGGAAEIATDHRIAPDGFTRMLVFDRSLLPRQAGRLVQRLAEIQTYRDMALLALPKAREAAPTIARIDAALAELTGMMTSTGQIDDEQRMLERLITLSAEIEENIAATSYRFAAARAYEGLVIDRVTEIAEVPLADHPTPSAYVDRRFTPAMRTCASTAARQSSLSERATRAANLLRTRVDITLEAQNRDLLASMDRRAKLQLRLQQTVEGLSVAAITYYLVSLVGYLLYAMKAAGVAMNVPVVQGLSVPVVAGLIWLGARRARRRLTRDDE